MRPGQLTPENLDPRSKDGRKESKASMRPGQLTPENLDGHDLAVRSAIRFNEAGAINPGKRPRRASLPLRGPASMRPGQLTPENVRGRLSVLVPAWQLQ